MQNSKIVSGLVAILVIATLILAGCSQPTPAPAPAPAPKPAPAPAPKPTVAAGQQREQALQALYNAAKAEGEVLVQTALNVSQFQPLIEAFQKKFPGIKVSAFNVNSQPMVARVVTEAAAGKLTVDVGQSSPDYLAPLLERNMLVSYDWPKTFDIDPSLVALDGKWILGWEAVSVFMYNTKMLTAAQAPKSFQDLLDPKWQGKITVTGSGIWASFLFDAWQKDKQKATDIMKQLVAQKPLVAGSGSDTANKVGQGEVPLGYTVTSQFIAYSQKGAPIAIAPISPVWGTATGMYIPKNSPHPNAALLLMGWLGSKEARLVWQKNDSMTLSTEGLLGKLLKDAGIRNINLVEQKDLKDYADMKAAAAALTSGLSKK